MFYDDDDDYYTLLDADAKRIELICLRWPTLRIWQHFHHITRLYRISNRMIATSWCERGRRTQRSTCCQQPEPNSESAVFVTAFGLLETVFLLACMSLLTLAHSNKKASIRWHFTVQFQYSRVHLFYDIQWKRIRGIPFIVKSHNNTDNKSKCIF